MRWREENRRFVCFYLVPCLVDYFFDVFVNDWCVNEDGENKEFVRGIDGLCFLFIFVGRENLGVFCTVTQLNKSFVDLMTK